MAIDLMGDCLKNWISTFFLIAYFFKVIKTILMLFINAILRITGKL